MTVQLNILEAIAEGQRLRDIGIANAINHADAVSHGWSNKAFNLFCAWLKEKGRGRNFKTEDFRIHCELTEAIIKPPSDRAYGSITVRAAKAGLIRKIGYATVSNPRAHSTPATLWQVV